MMRVVAILCFASVLFVGAGCAPQVTPGTLTSASGKRIGPEWLTSVQGGDAYLQVQAETHARDKSQGGAIASLCSSNALARWYNRDDQSAVLISVNDQSNTPVFTNVIADQSSNCETLYLTHRVGTAVLIPLAGFGNDPIRINFRVISTSKDKVNVGTIVADSLTVAAALAGPGAAPAIATTRTISQVLQPLGQSTVDSATQGTQSVGQTVSVDLDRIRAKDLIYTAPLVSSKDSRPIADVYIRVEIVPSIFVSLRGSLDPSGRTAALDLSNRNPSSLLYQATIVDPRADNETTGKKGEPVPLRTWFLNRYGDGADSYQRIIADINKTSNLDVASKQLDEFCAKVRKMSLPLTDRDWDLLVWALLAFEAPNALTSPDLFPPAGNTCFDGTAYGVLRAAKVSPLPGSAPAVAAERRVAPSST